MTLPGLPTPVESGLPRYGYGAEVGSADRQIEHLRWRMAGSYDVHPDDAARFGIRATTWQLGRSVLVSAQTSGLTFERSNEHVRTDDIDNYGLQINARSDILVDADGRRIRVAPGHVAIKDFARPETARVAAGPHLTLLLPRDEVDRLLPGNFDLHGVPLGGVAGSLLAGHLLSLEAQLPTLQLAEAGGAMMATLHLLAASLAPSVQSLGLARPAIERSVLAHAKRFIERQLGAASLGPDALCAHLGISRSALYRLFAPLGGVASYVRERRLAQVHALLTRNPERAGRAYLGRLADDYGFTSASHFSRVFREQFGYSPREAREMAPAMVQGALVGSNALLGDGRFGRWNFEPAR